MGIIYLAALIVGIGTLSLQLLSSGKDIDADAGFDVDADADFDADGDFDADADANGHVGHGAGGFLPIFLSLRFWTFAFFAFGMVGTLLHYFRISSSLTTAVAASVMGLGCGALASWIFQRLSRNELSSAAHTSETVGQVAKLLIPPSKHGRGKVRVEIRGQTVDLLATSDDQLDAGELVLVEEIREGMAQVSKAPPEFLPPKTK